MSRRPRRNHSPAFKAKGRTSIAGLRPDPRITHTLNLRDDEYGNPLQRDLAPRI